MKQEYIEFSLRSISKTIEKQDVVLVYLNNGECWVCTKDKPLRTNKSVKYKLATLD